MRLGGYVPTTGGWGSSSCNDCGQLTPASKGATAGGQFDVLSNANSRKVSWRYGSKPAWFATSISFGSVVVNTAARRKDYLKLLLMR